MIKKLCYLAIAISLTGCFASTKNIVSKDEFYNKSKEANAKIIEMIHENKSSPTVLLAHGCDGMTSFYYNWGREIYNQGYNVVLVDSFSNRGIYSLCENGKSWLVGPHTRGLDLIETGKYVKTQNYHNGKLYAIGFSHGGTVMFRLAEIENGIFDKLVAYYPSCRMYQIPHKRYVKLMVHIGTNDDWTKLSDCVINNEYDSNLQFYKYEGATHGFDIPASTRNILGHYMSYDSRATELSKKRTFEFFK